ncbi:hypothetical protein LSH36_395g02070 [Paralvinella palmiformis]|uniref:Uncharacterized protein n=1 Tax=Paralvinella palmiformis TaxID=53620 RepID=A0AAD9JDC4_9ANNE|nr:hypothetical protein LSH36_395g02070 [Paralvinella palmiformis]
MLLSPSFCLLVLLDHLDQVIRLL